MFSTELLFLASTTLEKSAKVEEAAYDSNVTGTRALGWADNNGIGYSSFDGVTLTGSNQISSSSPAMATPTSVAPWTGWM